MSQPSPPQHPPPRRRPRINQVNVDMVEVEDPDCGLRTVVPRARAPADGILDPRQTFVVESVPGQPDLCVVRWWYGLEEWVSRDRIPRVAIAEPDPDLTIPARAPASSLADSLQLTSSLTAPVIAGWGGDGAVLCPDERWLIACACGRREFVHPHSPMLLAGTCRECLPGQPDRPAEPLRYPHLCFSQS
jgi:hypothetical protein